MDEAAGRKLESGSKLESEAAPAARPGLPRSSPPAAGGAPSGREMMVVAGAREIRDGEIVFVGMRLPIIAFHLAKLTHAPRAVALYENGVIREHPAAAPLRTMADPPNLRQASMCSDLQAVMSLLQQGRVDLGFLGAGEVDRFGNLNSTLVADDAGGTTRLPGSGGAADIACLARRTVILLTHERRRFRERVHYVTGPGYGDGRGWREREGLGSGGPAAIITDRAVLRFDEDGEAYLASVHPGVRVADVLAATGWPLRVREPVPTTEPPTAREMNLLATVDPAGFWTRGSGHEIREQNHDEDGRDDE
jgi:glutaconate CoA-transferase subunit B